jgi:hypothetical protein
MKLTDMKLKPRKEEDYKAPSTSLADEPKYPWGLQVTLENEQLEKLGVDKLPSVGTTLTLTAKVEVCSTGEYQAQRGGEERRSVQLQITSLALSGAESAVSGDDIYGDSKKK